MHPLESLKALLAKNLVLPTDSPERNTPQAITRTLHILRLARDRQREGTLPPGATRALLAFRLSQPAPDFLALKQICANASKAAGWDTRRLIDDPRLFTKLLQQVATLQDSPKLFRKCYRALLASYFGYPALSSEASPIGRDNWQVLGNFLRTHLDAVCNTQPASQWAVSLRNNAKFLDTPPPSGICATDIESRAAIQRQLGIPSRGGLFGVIATEPGTRNP